MARPPRCSARSTRRVSPTPSRGFASARVGTGPASTSTTPTGIRSRSGPTGAEGWVAASPLAMDRHLDRARALLPAGELIAGLRPPAQAFAAKEPFLGRLDTDDVDAGGAAATMLHRPPPSGDAGFPSQYNP